MSRRNGRQRTADRGQGRARPVPAQVWPLVHAERRALIADLEGVDEHDWALPSACEGWSVGDVAAHLVDSARTTRRGFVLGLVRARFDFDGATADGVRREGGRSPQQLLQRLREVADRTSTPPAPLGSRLVEEVVHGEDVRRPLGITRRYPVQALTWALQAQAAAPASFGGAKELLTRLRLDADDAPVSLGAGPTVTGPLLSLLLAATGRRAALGELAGEGLDTLTEWLSR